MIELLVLHEEDIMPMDRVDDSKAHVHTQRTQCLIGRLGTVMGEEEVAIDGDQIDLLTEDEAKEYLSNHHDHHCGQRDRKSVV